MKLKILSALIFIISCLIFMAPHTQAVDVNFFNNDKVPSQGICAPGTARAKSAVCQDNASQRASNNNPVIHVIQIATSIMALLAGLLAVIMIIISGFTLVTSGGSSDAVANSRKRIVNSLIGIVIVALAWTIIKLVTDNIAK